ncbi:MAG: hypothetical protein MPN21_15725 [Thermoanaerobaculia bacterium]|nr:hypothetical protein [Thermoanaerobaculia bacterium]
MDETNEPARTIPIVVDLGSRKRKRIKQLKRGEGPLVDEVYEAVDAVLEELGEPEESDGRTVVPVVLLYRRKRKKRKRGLLFPFG